MIEFFVIDENILVYSNPLFPQGWVHALASSILRGATCIHYGLLPVSMATKIRPATRADFATFRVCSEGYEKDKARYKFPAA